MAEIAGSWFFKEMFMEGTDAKRQYSLLMHPFLLYIMRCGMMLYPILYIHVNQIFSRLNNFVRN